MKLLPIFSLPLVYCGLTSLINTNKLIKTELGDTKCVTAVKPKPNVSYKYLVAASCNFSGDSNSLSFEKFDQEGDEFKLRVLDEEGVSEGNKCVCMKNKTSKDVTKKETKIPRPFLCECDDRDIITLYMDGADRLRIAKEPESKIDKCLYIELGKDLENLIPLRAKKCGDSFVWDSTNNRINSQLTGTVLRVYHGKKNDYMTIGNAADLADADMEFTYTSENKFQLTSSASDEKPKCLSRNRNTKTRDGVETIKIMKSITLADCSSADTFYVDNDTDADNDKEIHLILKDDEGNEYVDYLNCMQSVSYPKGMRNTEGLDKIQISGCQRRLGSFDSSISTEVPSL